MSATAEYTITQVGLEYATIAGQQVRWVDLICAALQDRRSGERDHRGMPTPPNDAHDLASAYRSLLASALPLIRQREEEVYREYCRYGVTTRDGALAEIGLGSWVSGPSPDRQSTWRAWKQLRERIEQANA